MVEYVTTQCWIQQCSDCYKTKISLWPYKILQWHHMNIHLVVSNHWSFNCLFNSLWRPTSNKHQSTLLSFCEGNSPVTGEFPAQRDSSAEKASIWWRHHETHHTLHLWWAMSIVRILENIYVIMAVQCISIPYLQCGTNALFLAAPQSWHLACQPLNCCGYQVDDTK